MKRIVRLSSQLANQIAAGEVIERPASVVKELLENSIDAQATNIQVDIEQGGVGLIRVCDNGVGIVKEDLELALARHATSKLSVFSDFEHLQSLGFRGEALASMSAVSRLILTSCAQNSAHAWQVMAEGIDMQTKVQPASHAPGTTVEVQDLFYNTPVRRKFLRSEKTEFLHIEDMLRKMALSQFDKSFSLKHNQRVIFKLTASVTEAARLSRVETLCGKPFLQHSLFVDFHAVGLRLWGWLGSPKEARSQTDLQYFYVNGRAVRDRLLMHAVRQAYDDKLPEGRHPCYVLYLELDPAAVDVNVHPTKHEVRFRESRLIHDFIVKHLLQALSPECSLSISPRFHEPVKSSLQVHEQIETYKTLHTWPEQPEQIISSNKKIIGIVKQKYVVLENPNGIAILNLQQLKMNYILAMLESAQTGEKLPSQAFLIPQTIKTSEAKITILMSYQAWMANIGIIYDQLSPGEIIIRELPKILKQLPLEEAFKQLPDLFESHTAKDIFKCLAELTARENFTTIEIQTFLDDILLEKFSGIQLSWDKLDNPSFG